MYNLEQEVRKVFGIKEYPKRTNKGNRALHLYYTLLADELNSAGLDMKKVLKPEIDIIWTPIMIKDYLWREVQMAMLSKRSTTELDTIEVGQVYDVLNRHLSEKFGVSVQFPSEEQTKNYLESLKKQTP